MNLQISDAIPDNTPVIIGVGQAQQDVPTELPDAINPVEITAMAIENALTDVGVEGLKPHIDRLTSIRLFSDCGPVFSCPFGSSTHMPLSIAKAVGINANHLIYSKLGGDQPQIQVAETAKALKQGETELAIICGGEAIANMKAAMRRALSLDWADAPALSNDIVYDDHGFDLSDLPISLEEVRHGFTNPMLLYALVETAHRLRLGLSVKEYRDKIAKVFSPFSKVAKHNPYAMFKTALSEGEISDADDKNPVLVSPYTKAMVAKDSVNQAATVIMTTVGKAKALGVSPDKYVFLNGYAKGDEPLASERPEIDKLPVLKQVINQAVKTAGIKKENISVADFYSCFPIVVFNSIPMMKKAAIERHTLTGGLPFFGGPGNNYTLHAIAEMVMSLRGTENYGLVHGNGGIMTKHAVGVYSTRPHSYENTTSNYVAESVTLESAPHGEARLLSYCLKYKNNTPSEASVLVMMEAGGRALAKFEGDLVHLETLKLYHPMSVRAGKRHNIACLKEG